MACGCESATACCASTSSPSSTSLRSPPTTIRPSAISVTPPPTGRSPVASAPTGAPISLLPSAPSSAPPHDAASMPTGPSATLYRVTPFLPRVEQVLCRRHAGADPLADEFALELGDTGDDGGQHAPVRRREVEGEAAHGDHRDAPGFQLLQRVQQVEGAAAPAGQLGHQHHIDLAPLRQGDDLAPLGAVDPRAGAGFPEHADHRVATARGKGRQVALLPLAGLVGG